MSTISLSKSSEWTQRKAKADVLRFMAELTSRIRANPTDEKLLAEVRKVLSDLDELTTLNPVKSTPDITEFLKGPLDRVWLHSERMEVYVRKAHHLVGGRMVPCFDIANVTVAEAWRGQGVFSAWLTYVEQEIASYGWHIMVENVLSPELKRLLGKRGYRKDGYNMFKKMGKPLATTDKPRSRYQALAVACPTCSAEPGKCCTPTVKDGPHVGQPVPTHRTRIHALDAAGE